MEVSVIQRLGPVEEPSDLDQYNFSEYAHDHFRDGSPYAHTKGHLRAPLHYHGNEQNDEGSLTLFNVMQRFMMDLPEPKQNEDMQEDTVFMRTLQRNADHKKGATFQRKIESVKQTEWTSLPPLSNMAKPCSNISKVRFICSYGIFRPELRDEIYSQLCLQLTDNASKTSTARGWILMALCLGCFPPSDMFLNFLRNFLRQGPDGYGEYCQKRLRRTLTIGARKLTPTLIELHAVKVEGDIMLPVTTMDGISIKYDVDSSTTCAELLQKIKEKLGLKSVFGFSVFAKVFDQIFNWGSGNESVLDVVSLCEQYALHKDLSEDNEKHWSIFIRKDIFLSSHNPSNDAIETDLIYSQIMGGIKIGEYTFEDEAQLAACLAKRYYIEKGNTLDDAALGEVIERSIPSSLLENGDHRYQMNIAGLIRDSFNMTPSIKNSADANIVKQEIVNSAKSIWAKVFSKVFIGNLVSGPKMPKGEAKVFMHSHGVNFVSTNRTERGIFSVAVDFDKIVNITNDGPKHTKVLDTLYVTFQTYEKTSFVFKSNGALGIKKLGNMLLEDYRRGDPSYASI